MSTGYEPKASRGLSFAAEIFRPQAEEVTFEHIGYFQLYPIFHTAKKKKKQQCRSQTQWLSMMILPQSTISMSKGSDNEADPEHTDTVEVMLCT